MKTGAVTKAIGTNARGRTHIALSIAGLAVAAGWLLGHGVWTALESVDERRSEIASLAGEGTGDGVGFPGAEDATRAVPGAELDAPPAASRPPAVPPPGPAAPAAHGAANEVPPALACSHPPPSGPLAPGPTGPEPPVLVTRPGASEAGGDPFDPGDWRVWWALNDDPLLDLRDKVWSGSTLTGSDDFYLGHGQSSGGVTYGAPPAARRQPVPRAPTTGGGAGGGPSGSSTPGPRAPGAGPAGPRVTGGPSTPGPGGGHGGHGGTYRGPGDSIPPANEAAGGGPASPFAGSPGRAGAVDPDHRELEERYARGGLAPGELEALVQYRVARVLHGCRRWLGERPSAMYFRFWGDNPFVLTQLDGQSTFGVDVDTASYALARGYLSDGHLPEKAQIRTEEFVNYFAPDVPAPLEGTFAIHTDLAPSRFGTAHEAARLGIAAPRWMLRVAVRGKEVSREERQPLALTFVVDTSGSMKRENRIELVKHALRLLVAQLDARDSIAIVAFSTEARLILPTTSAANRGVIEAAVYGLQADGSTNAEAGLKLGYELALAGLSGAQQSRVVLLSDGVANVGQTDQGRIAADVRRHREAGIFLNTVGVGMGNHNDLFLEQLANKGDGICNYVDSELEARRALVENFTGAFEAIARDVKVQVEFDPAQVFRYRLLGYENRAIADQDFRNDAVDAGEVGSGHQVVALYELELASDKPGGRLATVRLRWKAPTGAGRDPLEDAATEVEQPVDYGQASSWEGSSAGYKRSVLVAQFAEILRRSTHARDDSLDELIAEAASLARELGDPDFHEFVAMADKSRRLVLEARPSYDPMVSCLDAIRRNRVLRAEYEALELDLEAGALRDLERQHLELEGRVRDLIRVQVRGRHHGRD